ncbi:hypothetical protein CMV_023252 [Castanea mollissima]|uniref:LRAT domain-containing protein n=1 Tax=Castanea mollissima TaxID=60419 RepID=A0A8J4QMM0_9ROSI|nr:hypothetical protein CMV_023252 [Castanea mollissima]
MGLLSNKIERENLKPGDHIYSWRHAYIYAHHGIYVSEGNVIHFTRGGGQEIGMGNFLDRIIVSSSPSRPSDNPCPRCGDQSRLDGVISSCMDCFLSGGELYIFEYSVSPALFIAKARGGTIVKTLQYTAKQACLSVGYGMYCFSRLVSDMGVRRDVKKVPVEILVSRAVSDESEAVTEMAKAD